MKTSGTFTFLFVTLLLISLISCTRLRQEKIGCTRKTSQRETCDETLNKYNGVTIPHRCFLERHCNIGRFCDGMYCADQGSGTYIVNK
jgi:hypothetical protein